MDLDFSNITPTAARADFAAIEDGADTLQLQLAVRPDFQLCAAPIIPGIAVGASLDLAELNQATTYYGRARSVIEGIEQPWSEVAALRTLLDEARDLSAVAVTHAPTLLVVPEQVLEWNSATTVAGFPTDNLGYDAPVAWRSQNPAAHAFTARMAAAPVDTIALLMSNAPESATVTVSAGATEANASGGAPTFSYGPVPFRASPNLDGRPGFHALLELPAAQAFAWWQVEIAAAVPGGIFHLEHAVFGRNRKTKNHSVEKTETPTDLGSLARSRSGIPQRALGWRMRRVEFDISAMDEGQYEASYADLGWRVGNIEPVLVVPNSKAGSYLHDRILYGALSSSSRISNIRGPLFTRSFSIDSLI